MDQGLFCGCVLTGHHGSATESSVPQVTIHFLEVSMEREARSQAVASVCATWLWCPLVCRDLSAGLALAPGGRKDSRKSPTEGSLLLQEQSDHRHSETVTATLLRLVTCKGVEGEVGIHPLERFQIFGRFCLPVFCPSWWPPKATVPGPCNMPVLLSV